MEVTIDLPTCKIIVFLKSISYAVFIVKLTGESFRLTIPQLIEALERVAGKQ